MFRTLTMEGRERFLSRRKQWHWRNRFVVCGLVLVLASVLIVASADAAVAFTVGEENGTLWCPPCSPDPGMNATQDVYNGQPFMWQIPPHPVAVLFALHGGGQDAFMYFDHGPGCPECYGLPEYRGMVLDALQRGYAVIALKSIGDGWDSWPLETSKDIPIATGLVKDWTRQHSLENLPLVIWGHSDGGRLATALPFVLSVQGLLLTSSGGIPEAEQRATSEQYPPALFVYIPNYKDTSYLMTPVIKKAMATLVQRGVSVAELLLSTTTPVSPHFFSDRIRCVSKEISKAIYAAYKAADGWLDDDDFVLKNAYYEDWEEVLWKANILPICSRVLGKNALDVQMELRVAYGHHGFTAVRDDEIFSWLNSNALTTSWKDPESGILARRAGLGIPWRTVPEIMMPLSAS